MRKARAQKTNLFKRIWRITGGGFITGVLLVLAITSLIVLVGIEVWSITEADNSGSSISADIADEAQGEDQEDEEGWIGNLDEDDTTNIGNRVNTSQLPDSSFIYDVSIEELANADSYLDGQTVQITGEVVGDRITSETNPKYCWITIQSQGQSDDEVSVYMSKTASKVIDTYGSYGKVGTILQVRGTFNLASKDHQGASEIVAESVSVVTPGEIVELAGNPKSLETGLIFILIGSILMLAFNIMRERQR